jgi:hypothetical protein
MSKEQLKMNVDITQTTPMSSAEGNQIFQEAVVLRKLSKFLVETGEDAVIPIPVFIDVKTGKILIDMLPKELKAEYEIYNNK